MKRVFYTVNRKETERYYKDFDDKGMDDFDIWLALQRDHRTPFIKIEDVVEL